MHNLNISMPSQVVLTHRETRAVLVPEIGGSIAEFSSSRDAQTQHWLRPASVSALIAREPLGMASFPLVPWCNRIRNGQSTYGAKPIALKPNYPSSAHTIHGTAWQRPWSVVSTTPSRAVLQIDHAKDEWPYRFTAQQIFEVDADNGLKIEMSITNLDDVAMPAGIGHHPYFLRPDGTSLTVSLESIWESDSSLLPTHLSQPPLLDTLRAGCLVNDLDLDNNFTGWSHVSRVHWPTTGTALELKADTPLDYFVIYARPNLDHFCIEPVSNCTDWMNLAQEGKTNVGGQMLAPGEQLSASFNLRPEWPRT
jgi:aldose 1-epimerase